MTSSRIIFDNLSFKIECEQIESEIYSTKSQASFLPRNVLVKIDQGEKTAKNETISFL